MKKNTLLGFLSVAIAAAFIFAMASCSDDQLFFPEFEVPIYNPSDTCNLTDLNLIYRVDEVTEDTIIFLDYVGPSDSSSYFLETQDYVRLYYFCNCPDDTISFQQKMVTGNGTGYGLNRITLSCN